MKEICYIDVTQLQGGAIFCKDYDLIFAGTTISSMPESNKDDTYIMLEDLYDICFIFDNHIPVVDFYAVPRIDIFAADSNNGFWGTIGDITDINNMFAPICYINNQKEIFIVAENFKIFYYQVASVQET